MIEALSLIIGMITAVLAIWLALGCAVTNKEVVACYAPEVLINGKPTNKDYGSVVLVQYDFIGIRRKAIYHGDPSIKTMLRNSPEYVSVISPWLEGAPFKPVRSGWTIY